MRSPFLYAEVLMKTIDELWYGNISPFEQCTRGDKRLKELLKLVARNREDLDGSLTEKQKETLEKFEECMNEMHSLTISVGLCVFYFIVENLFLHKKMIFKYQ